MSSGVDLSATGDEYHFHLDFATTASDASDMVNIAPTKIRYIKLGAGGAWEGARDRGRVEWGSPSDRHLADFAGDWEAVAATYLGNGHAKALATGYTNEARAFFDDDPDVVWITFARGRMWWASAEPGVHADDGDGKAAGLFYRVARGGWRDTDAVGVTLEMDRLSTRLTQLAGYRRTICTLAPDQDAMCRRYIDAALDPVQLAITDARAALRSNLTLLIQRLSWHDFEQFVDLALARSGWLRVSDLGGTAKDIDLIVEQPLTRERMAVQVKSSATQQVVDDYARRLGERSAGERSMLICHSPVGPLTTASTPNGTTLELMLGDAVTDLALGAGLIDWIVARAR